MRIVLSILIITHNQRDLLKRCVSSVIAQELEVPFEIIISDDRSSDGTDSYVHGLKKKYEGKRKNLAQIKYVRCNSDECFPLTVSERCGWNKLTAYKQAHGKYFVNIDADDYLRTTDIYQLQIDALESHQECSMCMQRALVVNEGDNLEKGRAEINHSKLVDGRVLSPREFILDNLKGVNPTYMIRRRFQDDMESLYGKRFDDTIITYHHLQYGPVVFVDRADYVWVRYPQSITQRITLDKSSDDDIIVYGLLPLYHAKMIPAFRFLFLRQGLSTMVHMFKWAPKYPCLSSQYKAYLSRQKGFIYQFYTENRHSLFSRIRYSFSRFLMLVVKRFHLTGQFWLSLVEFCLVA